MKIGIVTFFDVPNYGAMLQALALWKFLETRGHEVKFVNYEPNRQIKLCQCFSRTISETKKRLHRYVRQDCTSFASTYPKGTLYEHYDALIVGSDQIWNPTWMLPKLPIVFLAFAPPECKRISYAASFGARKWGTERHDEVASLLRQFDAISVREKSGVTVVKELCGQDAEVMPDPTLLWHGDFYRNYIGMENKALPGKYVLSFMLDEWSDGEAEAKCSMEVAKALKIKEVRTTYDYGRFPLSLICRVLGIKAKISLPKWLGLIDGAQAVVTNSFHGMVFSILFHKPFIVLKHRGAWQGMNDRITTTLSMLTLSERAIYPDEIIKIPGLMQKNINWNLIEFVRKSLREKTDTFFTGVGI